MIQEKEVHRLCFYYEMFMERAYGTYEANIPGYHAHNMRRLMMAEKELAVSVESVAHFEEQLIEIKKQIENAIDNYISKPHVPKDIVDELIGCKEQVVWVVNSDELMKIVFKTIDLTVSIPLDMK